jgi:anti-sigma B factor antagonist
LDTQTSPKVKVSLLELVDGGQRKIIVDLEQVLFIDSSGLVALVSGLRLARKENGSIVLSGVQPQAQVVFQLTTLDKIFTIQPTVEKAAQSLV